MKAYCSFAFFLAHYPPIPLFFQATAPEEEKKNPADITFFSVTSFSKTGQPFNRYVLKV